jgi:hypothetical protein
VRRGKGGHRREVGHGRLGLRTARVLADRSPGHAGRPAVLASCRTSSGTPTRSSSHTRACRSTSSSANSDTVTSA